MQATVQANGIETGKTGPINGNGAVESIGIAGIKVVQSPDRIRTVLGSCIGVAVYDRIAKIGGMAHVILPDSNEGSGDPGKFADTAVDLLVQELVDTGAEVKRLVAKIGGGAAMFGQATAVGLGVRNAEAVRKRLTHHAIRIAADALGGTRGRKMMLDPATGAVQVEIIGQDPEII